MKAMFLNKKKANWESLHRLCSIYLRRREYIERPSLCWEIQIWWPGNTSCPIPFAFKESVEYSPVWVLLIPVSPLPTSTHVGCLWEHTFTHKHFWQFFLLNIFSRSSHFSLIINTFPYMLSCSWPETRGIRPLWPCSVCVVVPFWARIWKQWNIGENLLEHKSRLNFSGILRASCWAQLF